MNTTPKTALITGASSGIGQAIAYKLAQAGHRIVVNYNKNSAGAKETVDTIKANGGEAFAVQADISDYEAVQRMFAEAEEKYEMVDILINNAGIVRDSLLLRMSNEDFDKVIDTNLKGAFYCSKLAIRKMVKKRWGRIVNISSVVGILGNPGQSNYAASKGAMNSFGKSLAREVGTRNVTVNSIAPGYVETVTGGAATKETEEMVFAFSALKRKGQPVEVAALAAFLASEEARFITGVIIRADGGL